MEVFIEQNVNGKIIVIEEIKGRHAFKAAGAANANNNTDSFIAYLLAEVVTIDGEKMPPEYYMDTLDFSVLNFCIECVSEAMKPLNFK